MDKKGFDTRTVLWVFYIVLVLIMTYFLYNYIDDLASGEGFNKKYFVNDLGLTFDAISSANGDLEITYSNLEDYDIAFAENFVKIQDEAQVYYFVNDKNFQSFSGNLNLKPQDKLVINKNNNVVSVNAKKDG